MAGKHRGGQHLAVKPLHRVAAEIPRIPPGLCVCHEQKKKYRRPWSKCFHACMMSL
jgi:hypothetical protein